jgi:hypothetical protein
MSWKKLLKEKVPTFEETGAFDGPDMSFITDITQSPGAKARRKHIRTDGPFQFNLQVEVIEWPALLMSKDEARKEIMTYLQNNEIKLNQRYEIQGNKTLQSLTGHHDESDDEDNDFQIFFKVSEK